MPQIKHPLATSDHTAKALAYWAANPVEAVKDWFGASLEDYQGDIIHSLLAPGNTMQPRVAAKSSHGVGKTTTLAWAGWIFLNTRVMSKLVATAPTAHQLLDILWPEFSKWHARMPAEISNMWEMSATHIRCKHKQNGVDYGRNWFATARTSNKPDNMQGFHEDHIMVLVDEAPGVAANIFEVIEGILSNAEEKGQEAILAMAGNPTQTAGEFFNSFHKNSDLYSRFTISGDPNSKPDRGAGKFYYSKRVSKKYRDNMAKKYGLESMVYDVRVRGLFPTMADDVVIPLEWAEKAQFVPLPHFDDVADPITLIMDVARFGGDKTTLAVQRGGHVLSLDTWPKTSGNKCCDIMVEAYKYGAFGVGKVPVSRVIVDEPGVGGPVIDMMIRAGIPVIPYNGGLTMKKDVDAADDVRMFFNRRARDWWALRRKMELGLIHIPENEELVNQLASVKYDYFVEKIKVETKGDMRDRLGDGASPDEADTIVMGNAPFSGVGNIPEMDLTDLSNPALFGEDRPTANQDF